MLGGIINSTGVLTVSTQTGFNTRDTCTPWF